MNRPRPLTALVLPADTPIRRSTLKRLVLYFDTVSLVDPSDRALLNEREIVETFPGPISRIEWGEQVQFPRVLGYEQLTRPKSFHLRVSV